MATTAPREESSSVSAAGARMQLTLTILGLVGLVVFFVETRVAAGRISGVLFEHHRQLVSAAGVLVVPVLLLGCADYVRARSAAYVPPSGRVQLSRSLAYGLALGAANLLLILGLRPELIWHVRELRSWLPTWAVLSTPYAIGAWYLCLRRREFDCPELPSYQDAVDALCGTDEFIVGVASDESRNSVSSRQQWQIIPELGMFGNVYVLGGIGSGKTSAVAKPLLEQAIFKWPENPGRKNAVFALDAKGNMAEWISAVARLAGRAEDVIVLRPGGECSYNPLSYGSPSAVAQKLVAALATMTAQQDDANSYYQKMQREFCENAMQILSDVLGAGKVSMMDLYNFICDPGVQAKFVESAAPTNSVSYRWFRTQWAREDPREQMMLTKGFRADLSQFVRDEIAPTFATASPNFPGWEALLDDGKIVVFSMSLDEYGPFARALGIFVLMDFQSVMLARTTPRFRSENHNSERLVLACLDEVWAYMNPRIADFTSVSREARCCTLALHQSLGQVPEEYRQVVLGNFRTPIVLAVNDLLSLNTFSQLFGTHKVLRRSVSESSGFQGVEQQMLSDHLRARMGGESKTLSTSFCEVDEPRFTTDRILHLPKNHAVVQMFDGDDTHHARVIQTLPHYLGEYRVAGSPA